MAGIRRLFVKVRGRVQGVGYRYFVLRAAHARKLTGFVRNEPDGSVVVEAQGAEALLEELLQELRFGPAASQVENVHADWLEPVKTEGDFTIRF